ncbi:MAG: heavy-metal-associated domain-containing protein, partial [Sphingopyxis sp.]|nr:heavy-metal-associated domain-containing protein [Sphingopyxis sp.]
MTSAAFPRSTSGFSLRALAPRDWRWPALFGLFFAILHDGVVDGQISRGDLGIIRINRTG